MFSVLKNFKFFPLKPSLQVTAFITSNMSSTTRILRSGTSVKVENDARNDKQTENGPRTSKYFRKKLIKKETGTIVEKVETSVKNARALKSKPKNQVSSILAKPQAQKVIVKEGSSIPDIVITEALNDDDLTTSAGDRKATNEQKTVANKVSTKKIKIGNRGKTRKTAIRAEQISPRSVKTEVLSDEEFTSVPAKNDSTLGLEKDGKNIMSPKKRKQPSIKTEPNSIEMVKTELLSEEESTGISPRKRKPVQKAEKARKLKSEAVEDIEDMGWQPENWRIVLDNILEMRKWQSAPVDMMGCEECPEKDVPPEVFRYQTLISVMLSSQTRDEVTYAATQRLIANGLTVDSILAMSDEKIGKLIYPAGFWKSKVKFIRNTTQILKDQYNGDIPRTFKELCNLPGVGPKMANIVMSVGWKETVGIAVDTHVHRISNRLGWLPKPTKDPEQTRKALEAWLPKELWDPINITMVGFGQTICRPVGPSCHKCLNSELCPFGRSALKEGLKKSPKK